VRGRAADIVDMNAAKPQPRGLALILEHCARLDSEEQDDRPAAATRLRQAIGDELARLLLSALSGDHRGRLHVI
jgi:hypothetical protein